MKSDYKRITTRVSTYIYYINYNYTAGTIAVYLNGLRLFLDLDYSIGDQTVTILNELHPDDLLIISWC